MKNLVIFLQLSLTLVIINGCSSDEVEKTVNIIDSLDTTTQQTYDYESEKYRPYGFFFGELASSGESINSIMLIDDFTNSYFIYTGVSINYGEFKRSGNDNFTSVNAKKYSLDSDSLLTQIWRKDDEDENTILKYTFDENSTFSWSITKEGTDTIVTLPKSSNIASSISRMQPLPSRNNIISNQFLIQHRGGILPAYNLTIDFTDDGVISGSDSDNCIYNGKFSTGNKNLNIYQIELDIDNCSYSGNYDGLAAVNGVSESVSSSIVVMVKSNTAALFFTASAN